MTGLKTMSQKKIRKLNDGFINDLENGILSPLLDAVRTDTSLCLELRGHSVNVYYRGGSLMKITQLDNGYTICFDEEYFKGRNTVSLPAREIYGQEDVENWRRKSPEIKHAMDCYFGNNRRDEREFQQLMVLDSFSQERPILLLVCANHDPEKSALRQSLEEIPNTQHVDVRIATASFLGYALYDQGIHTIEEAREHFGDYLGPS